MSGPAAIIGLDIGGANLKAARWLDPKQVRAVSSNFPMWKQPNLLAAAVQRLLAELDAVGQTEAPLATTQLAVTMTGELADCFASRREGAARIVDQLCQVVQMEQLSIYAVDGSWLTATQSKSDPWHVAASNWHALATWLAQWPPTAHAFDQAVLVDIGSTTVDVLPIARSKLATNARTDRQRLERSQLVYTGVRRTPVCAVLQSFSLNEKAIPVMAELFSTVDDAYLLLDLVEEDANDNDTADSRPRTKAYAAARLARMIGEDAERLTALELMSLANQVIEAQADQVAQAINCNLRSAMDLWDRGHADSPCLICSGHGLPLFERAVRKVTVTHRSIRLNEHVSTEVSRCAPAAAVAWLRQKREQ